MIKKVLDYYDNNMEEQYSNHINVKYFKLDKNDNNDLSKNKLIFYDKNNTKIMTSTYEKIGKYQVDTINNINKVGKWTWAWADSQNTKNEIYISKDILNYAINSTEIEEIKDKLIMSSFLINNYMSVIIFIAIALYLSKKKYIIKIINIENETKLDDQIKYIHDDIDFIANKKYSIEYLYSYDYLKMR
jgi:hypothetical protein